MSNSESRKRLIAQLEDSQERERILLYSAFSFYSVDWMRLPVLGRVIFIKSTDSNVHLIHKCPRRNIQNNVN